jgi:hypothetical protein
VNQEIRHRGCRALPPAQSRRSEHGGQKARQRFGEIRSRGIHREEQADAAAPKTEGGIVLLSGGNPQIAKGYGDSTVQEYIKAMPGWKNAVGKRLDRLIVESVPRLEKAVKWNSPFYGVKKDIWFLSFHCMTKYVKVAFFRGGSLDPRPPGESKQKDVR